MLTPYHPEPYVDFSQPEPRRRMLEALAAVRGQLGRVYTLRIGDQPVEMVAKIESRMPARPDTLVGRVARANIDQADDAIKAAAAGFETWRRVDAATRSRILVKAAAIMRRRVYELAAWMCFEVGKSWLEAYADACEAIDFLEFYAREMLRLSAPQPVTPYPGEDNEVRYIPLGVAVVIPPWNFPLAICAGMTSAALVTGNAVVLKPSSSAAVIAAKFVEVMEEAGLPPGVLNFLPGQGLDIGDALVEHPLTRLVAFTGSKEVGLGVYARCGRVTPGQMWLKRCILEMGGKDCIIVDETADLDAAADGVVASAFGFQGQKCSACSRLVAVREVYEPLIDKVVARTRGLTMGDTTGEEPVALGPVISAASRDNILSYIEIGRGEGRVVLGGGETPKTGYFVPPTIIADVSRDARIAQEEIFGPVLAVLAADDFDDALDIANGTEFGLTGGVYSHDRFRLEQAREEFHVGNLYFNRKCTGALVDVQPFGGFNMSGTDSKAGGRDYLQLFMQAKTVTERF